MVKNNFKLLLLMTFIAIYFSSNLFAMQSVVEKQAVESSPLLNESEDAFIREFVKSMNDPKVQYDGKKLILSYDVNYKAGSILAGCFYGVISLLILSIFMDDENFFKEMAISGTVAILIAYFLNRYCEKYYKENPLITMGKNGISVEGELLKWENIDFLRKEYNSTFSHSRCVSSRMRYKFFDKFMTLLLDLNSDEAFLPITFSNLQVVLDHYIKIYGEKIKMEYKENTFNEVNVTNEHIYYPILRV